MTLRAILLGLGVAVAVYVEVGYVEYVLHASRLTLSHFPMGMLIVFLGVVVGVNALLRPRLSPPELLVILGMGLAAGAIPSVGLTGYFLGVLASPFYFASPENQWADYFHPHIPPWLAPRNRDGAIDYLYEGLPDGALIPWDVWVVPLLWWGTLIGAFVVVSLCLAVIFRKQWSEHERLVYPLLRPALEMVHRSDAPGRLPAFMRGRIFWSGFVLAFGILCWNMISHFVPGFPQVPNIQWGPWIFFQRPFPGIWTRINMFTISFAYFANVDVLFSLWFFDLLFILRSGILNRFGLNASTPYHGSATYIRVCHRELGDLRALHGLLRVPGLGDQGPHPPAGGRHPVSEVPPLFPRCPGGLHVGHCAVHPRGCDLVPRRRAHHSRVLKSTNRKGRKETAKNTQRKAKREAVQGHLVFCPQVVILSAAKNLALQRRDPSLRLKPALNAVKG